MNKPLIRRIFAIIALVAVIGATVFGMLCFFNEFNWIFGTVATICLCVTAVFGIPVYILRPQTTELGKPTEGETEGETDGETADGSAPTESETERGESDVDADDNVVPNGEGKEESKDE